MWQKTSYGGTLAMFYRMMNDFVGAKFDILGPILLTWFNFNPSMDE